MPRTTAALVRGILKIKTTIDLEPFITPANEIVTEICAPVLKADGVTPWHTVGRLTLIETWLAAHFAAVAHRRRIQEAVSGIQQSMEGKVDLHLDVTEYGQQAMILDTSGKLAALNNAIEEVPGTVPGGIGKKSLFYLGKRS